MTDHVYTCVYIDRYDLLILLLCQYDDIYIYMFRAALSYSATPAQTGALFLNAKQFSIAFRHHMLSLISCGFQNSLYYKTKVFVMYKHHQLLYIAYCN